jgi:hypothetical protein
MSDFEVYSTALEADSSYAATLSRSLSLVLEEFYAGIKTCGVSALTGEGMDELFEVRWWVGGLLVVRGEGSGWKCGEHQGALQEEGMEESF